MQNSVEIENVDTEIARSAEKIMLVSHDILFDSTEQSLISALPRSQQSLPRHLISVKPEVMSLKTLDEVSWGFVKRRQVAIFRDRIQPGLSSGTKLVYFGAAPIPLAMHLGYLVGAWQSVEVFQYHHSLKSWSWVPPSAGSPPNEVRLTGMPESKVDAPGDIIVRVSTSHLVNRDNTIAVVPSPLAEYEISLNRLGEDALETPQLLEAVAEKFKLVLDNIALTRPNAKIVHVFSSVPVGLAFRLGTKINPTMTSKVQTYQFSQSTEKKYTKAITLDSDTAVRRELTTEERQSAASFRNIWKTEFEKIKEKFSEIEHQEGHSWALGLLGDRAPTLTPDILSLAPISKTTLLSDSMGLAVPVNVGGFKYFHKENEWLFEDELICDILKEMGDVEKAKQATRLLVFHEAIHDTSQNLTAAVAVGIGRFPKVLEEIDYEADVWALLHEIYYLELCGQPIDKKGLYGAIETAISTFWAFDRRESFDDEIQIRRINRYLNWHWQLFSVAKSMSIKAALAVLNTKPTIELAGPKIISNGSRVFFDMHSLRNEPLELSAKRGNRIIRAGESQVVNVAELLESFKRGDAEAVKKAFQGFFDLHCG